MTRIALLDDYQGVALEMAPWDELRAQFPDVRVEVRRNPLPDEDAAAEALQPYAVVMALRERTPFPRSLLERLPNLKLLCTAGMRNAAIDTGACTELGIPVCGTAGGSGTTMEHTWGLMLALLRHIPREERAMRAGRWQETVGTALAGKTLGLVGLGRIGGGMATVAHAFGMRVIAWSTNLTDERAAECGAERMPDLHALLAQADVVSIHTRLSERTRGLLGAAELAAMKPGARLVNTSRGPIVDEEALVAALRNAALAGAALDVYGTEPLPADHPLLGLDNVVLTPHLGYVEEGVYRTFYGQTLENVRAWLDGSPTRLLNPDVQGRERPR